MLDQEPIVKHVVVDNRAFLLGLDELYRNAMKPHERGELLECALDVASALGVDAADVPIEGYYVEDESLTLYFRLMRALQRVSSSERDKVQSLGEFNRLEEITGSDLFGASKSDTDSLLPQMKDALSHALELTGPNWTIERLTDLASEAAHAQDDFSLSGLASLVKDPVVLTALRESVVLYVMHMLGGTPRPVIYECEWKVDRFLASQATRFVAVFAELFQENLPEPGPVNAEQYWRASQSATIVGRCVRLGYDDTVEPARQYHWAICIGSNGEELVQEFWADEIWTTELYRERQNLQGGCLNFQ